MVRQVLWYDSPSGHRSLQAGYISMSCGINQYVSSKQLDLLAGKVTPGYLAQWSILHCHVFQASSQLDLQ